MIYLSQRDLRWAGDKLGASKITVGKFGCTTTVISMIAHDFGCYKTPLELAHNANNYTADGLVLWNRLNKTFEGQMRFVWRGYGYKGAGYVSPMLDFTPILKALANPNQRVILQVNDGAHWVKLNKKNLIGKDWTAIDPWDGKECQVLAKYKNITGYAIFEDLKLDPTVTPPSVDKELAARLAGNILLSVDERGRLYYVTPAGKLKSLGSTAEEVQANLAKIAIGIKKEDLNKLPWA